MLKNCRELARGIKQKKEFLELNTPDDLAESLDYLIKADMGKFPRKTIKSATIRKKCGCLPKMVTSPKGSKGAWLASSFRERLKQWMIKQ